MFGPRGGRGGDGLRPPEIAGCPGESRQKRSEIRRLPRHKPSFALIRIHQFLYTSFVVSPSVFVGPTPGAISGATNGSESQKRPRYPLFPFSPVPPPGAEGDRHKRGEAASDQSKPAIFAPHENLGAKMSRNKRRRERSDLPPEGRFARRHDGREVLRATGMTSSRPASLAPGIEGGAGAACTQAERLASPRRARPPLAAGCPKAIPDRCKPNEVGKLSRLC